MAREWAEGNVTPQCSQITGPATLEVDPTTATDSSPPSFVPTAVKPELPSRAEQLDSSGAYWVKLLASIGETFSP